jgi:hypothetical protein
MKEEVPTRYTADMESRLEQLDLEGSIEGYLRNLFRDIINIPRIDGELKRILLKRAWSLRTHLEIEHVRWVLNDIEDCIKERARIIIDEVSALILRAHVDDLDKTIIDAHRRAPCVDIVVDLKANLAPELISRPVPELTPGSPPEIQSTRRTINETLPLEEKLDPAAIFGPAPNSAPGPPPEILQIRRPSPKDRTLRVQASVDEIGLVAFDALQHADELAQSISPDDTCFSFSARYSVEAQSIDSFSGGAIDKEYFGDNDNIISEQPGNLFALNLRVITGDDPPDLRSLPVDAPLEKISTKALAKEISKKSFAAVAAASTAPAPCTTCKQTAHRPGDTQKYHFRRAGWRDNPRDDFCNISICQASLKRCIYKDVADILARKYLLLRRKERTLLPM